MVRISNQEIMTEIENLCDMKVNLIKENENIQKLERKIESDKLNAKFLVLSTIGVGMLTFASISNIFFLPCALITTCLTLTTVDKIEENSKKINNYKKQLIKIENNKQMTELLLKKLDACSSVYYHRKNLELSNENVNNINHFLRYDNRYKEDIEEINNKYNYDNEKEYQKRIGVR